ncbi:MAG: type II secretion system minor pseudopilin GspJ, partial [Acidiferrobacterales bacterium]|nr:type II secretion system minor pseudopilin GspJ [Acidiferrobacterales bacterium]
MHEQKGLTLLELVVAVAIFALFSVMAYGALDQILTQRDHLEREQLFWRTLSLVMLRLQDDLSQARPRAVRDIDGNLLPALRGQPTDTRALGEPTIEFTRGGVLELYDGAHTVLQRVAYRLRDDALVRLVWPVLDRSPQTEPSETILLREVDSFSVRFFVPTG